MVSKAVALIFTKTAAAIQNGLKRSYKGLKGELFVLEYERMVYDFKEDKANENWITISDAEFGGKSEVAFEKSKHGQCVFRGNVSTVLPDDGNEAKYSGFCAAKSKPLLVIPCYNVSTLINPLLSISSRTTGLGRTFSIVYLKAARFCNWALTIFLLK